MFRITRVAVVAIAMAGCGPDDHDDPRLASLEVFGGGRSLDALTSSFDPNRHSYDIDVGFGLDRVQLVATPIDLATALRIDELPIEPGAPSALLTLSPGPTEIAVVGTSPDGTTARYTVTLDRADGPIQTGGLTAAHTEDRDYYGHAVAISGDTLAIAASRESSAATGIDGDQADNSAPGAGAVFIYTRTGTTWSQQAYIKASNAEAGDQFGESLALSGDTLVVSARYEDSAATGIDGDEADNTAAQSGAVYVFARAGSTWSQQAYIKAPDPDAHNGFGLGVSIEGDTLAISAPSDVYVYTRTGSTWSQQAQIDASNTEVGAFGEAISLSGDTLAVGAPADWSTTESGAAYVFTRAGSTWSPQAYIRPSNVEANDWFGRAVSLSGDTLAVGAPQESSAATGIGGDAANNAAAQAGAVYVFVRTGSMWSQEAYIKASNTDAGDSFGFQVALDGSMLAVGAPIEASAAIGIDGNQADNSAASAGAVYLFARSGTTWSQQSYIKSSNNRANSFFSRGISMAGGILAVGAPGEDCATTGGGVASWCGAAYVFE